MRTIKPWGYEEIIEDTPTYTIKRLIVNPNGRLSLQYHERKIETMILVSGTAVLLLQHHTKEMAPIVMVPQEPHLIRPFEKHRLTNPSENKIAIIIEVSTHEPGDVVRVEDDYGRSK